MPQDTLSESEFIGAVKQAKLFSRLEVYSNSKEFQGRYMPLLVSNLHKIYCKYTPTEDTVKQIINLIDILEEKHGIINVNPKLIYKSITDTL